MAGGDQVQVLKALDLAKTQWFSFTAIVIVGMGFFTVAYDLFCISLVTKLLGQIYYHVDGSAKPGTLPLNVFAAVNDVAFCGMLAGQLFFGWLGAKLGRRKVYRMTLMMVVICSVASGLSFGQTPKSVMATLCFFRFWLGFGIGGEYLFSATIMSEYAIKKTRGAFIAAVFAMQGFGILAGGIVAILVSSFKTAFPALDYAINATRSTVPQADYVWRIILMSGALPAALTYYWRIKVPETARYTAIVPKNVSDMSKVMIFDIEAEPEKAQESAGNHFGLFSKQLLHLLGTTITWFLLYMNALEEVYGIARAQTLIALCSTLAGYWFTVALIHKIRRFAIQRREHRDDTQPNLTRGILDQVWEEFNRWKREQGDSQLAEIETTLLCAPFTKEIVEEQYPIDLCILGNKAYNSKTDLVEHINSYYGKMPI
nr:inorganic phosphate transporter 1-4 [Ipomoea batatas]